MTSTAQANRAINDGLELSLKNLCRDDIFGNLEADLKVFNPFRVLKVERYELRHTTTLAWLLNPHETHGMADIFLRCFLKVVAPADAPFWSGANTSKTEVLAELVFDKRNGFSTPICDSATGGAEPSADRLDVLVEGRTTGNAKWCVAIEAKIDSKEGEQQLQRYDSWLTPKFSGHNLLKLYLTVQPALNGAPKVAAAEQQSAPWVNILWGEHVAKALAESLAELDRSGHKLKDRVREFLEDYKELLAGLSNDEPSGLDHRVHAFANSSGVSATLRTLQQCIEAKQVVHSWDPEDWVDTYWRHRALLDMCMSHVRAVDAEFLWERVIKKIAHDDTWHMITPITSKAATVAFVPRSWLDVSCLKTADNRWNLYYQAEFRNDKKDVEVKLYLPDAGDRSAQLALLGKLLPSSGSAQAPDSHFAPAARQLKRYKARDANSLKLYTVSANWKRSEDGSIDLDPGRHVEKDRRYQLFATAVQAHTQLITALV